MVLGCKIFCGQSVYYAVETSILGSCSLCIVAESVLRNSPVAFCQLADLRRRHQHQHGCKIDCSGYRLAFMALERTAEKRAEGPPIVRVSSFRVRPATQIRRIRPVVCCSSVTEKLLRSPLVPVRQTARLRRRASSTSTSSTPTSAAPVASPTRDCLTPLSHRSAPSCSISTSRMAPSATTATTTMSATVLGILGTVASEVRGTAADAAGDRS